MDGAAMRAGGRAQLAHMGGTDFEVAEGERGAGIYEYISGGGGGGGGGHQGIEKGGKWGKRRNTWRIVDGR